MPRINLLPWREERRKQRQRDFNMAAAGCAAAAIGAVAWWHSWIAGNIDYQRQRNEFLKTQITRVDQRIKDIKDLQATREQLLARMKIIERLQQSRPEVVHLFDQLVRTLPDGVYLTSFTQKGSTLTLEGIANSSARVSAYMRNIDQSDWLGDPNLRVIKSNNKGSLRRKAFTLTARQQVGKDAGAKGS
ncbi:MAG TPA: PilN domain-containing protein [Gammaproteobacteria bacterium]|nr:PilN domain-containing protein [Gammaproteobacteria bacterium]